MNTTKFLAALFILLLGVISSASAQMEFEKPEPRGNDKSSMSQAPCGGYNDVKSTTDIPLSTKVKIEYDDLDDDSILVINYAPTSDSPFVPASENVTVKNTDDEKDVTVSIDLAKAGAKPGDKGVLQAILTGEETWYQCADIRVVDGASSIGISTFAYFIILSTAFIMTL